MSQYNVVRELHAPMGYLSSSFYSEGVYRVALYRVALYRVALAEALNLLITQSWTYATIMCDCKSFVQALHNPYPTNPVIIALQSTAVDLLVNRYSRYGFPAIATCQVMS